mgnify:CR=1 FL=1
MPRSPTARSFTALKWMTFTALASFTPARKPSRPQTRLVRRAGKVDGKRFLTAMVAGYEVGCRVGMTGGASQLRRGFHPSATSGTFAAGAAAAKMLQLDPVKTLHTLGIAGTQAAGLMAAQHSSMVKRMHPGRSAQAGVYGALLANKGFTGIEDILEASYGGFCSTFCDNPNLSHLTQDLGERFETLNVGCKPYPLLRQQSHLNRCP